MEVEVKLPKPLDNLKYCRGRVKSLLQSIEMLEDKREPDVLDVVDVLSEAGSVISLLLNQLEQAAVATTTEGGGE